MTPSEERRWWSGFIDLAAARIESVFAQRHRFEGRVYDPQLGSGGAGFPCMRCRIINQSDARVCSSCGLILKMTP